MQEDHTNEPATLSLNTKLEADFVQPLSALRGALEILRDIKDLSPEQQKRFVEIALWGCSRLEDAVEHLGDAVYAAARPDDAPAQAVTTAFDDRIAFDPDTETLELDFKDYVFSNSDIVDRVYDAIESRIDATGRKWYVLIDFNNCRIWPEAWVAFAHRGKRLSVTRSLGTVRFTQEGAVQSSDPDVFPTREAAAGRIAELRKGG